MNCSGVLKDVVIECTLCDRVRNPIHPPVCVLLLPSDGHFSHLDIVFVTIPNLSGFSGSVGKVTCSVLSMQIQIVCLKKWCKISPKWLCFTVNMIIIDLVMIDIVISWFMVNQSFYGLLEVLEHSLQMLSSYYCMYHHYYHTYL